MAASHVYESKGWALVDDHISCALGRQSYQLGKSEEVLDHYTKLLRESRQSPQQQAVYMKEFLSVYRVIISERQHFDGSMVVVESVS